MTTYLVRKKMMFIFAKEGAEIPVFEQYDL